MSTLDEKRRLLEEKFFLEENQRQLEKYKQSKTIEDLQARSGISNNDLLQALVELDISAHNLSALALAPLVCVAWSDGSVSKAEKTTILSSLDEHGFAENTEAREILASWLDNQAPKDLFTLWQDYMLALETNVAKSHWDTLTRTISNNCLEVAQASGGFMGMGKVSWEEKDVLRKLRDVLKPE